MTQRALERERKKAFSIRTYTRHNAADNNSNLSEPYVNNSLRLLRHAATATAVKC